MAKPTWLIVDKSSGSGNDVVAVSTLAPHTGRTARAGVLTFRAAGVTDKTVNISQAGKPEFVTTQSAATVSKDGGNVTITGKSNSSKLTFSLGNGSLTFTLPASYLANSASTANGAAIVGDPGASVEYDLSITITGIPANTGASELTRQLIVTANGSQTATCLITQAAGDATLSVTPTTVNLDWEGTSQNLSVTSNTSWTVI